MLTSAKQEQRWPIRDVCDRRRLGFMVAEEACSRYRHSCVSHYYKRLRRDSYLLRIIVCRLGLVIFINVTLILMVIVV